MNILVCCEESQAIVTAYRSFGHNAFSCDIQRCSGKFPQYHILGDCRPFLLAHRRNYKLPFYTQTGDKFYSPGRWDLIIAHPPCTYLAKSSACNLFKNGILNTHRYKNLVSAAQFFYLFYNLPGRICIENPVPLKIANLPPFSQTIQPYQFGDNYTKLTCLWLKNLPYLLPLCYAPSGLSRSICKSWCSVRSGSKYRSKTFKGIALAIANQWRFE